jgi:hypothetical protein
MTTDKQIMERIEYAIKKTREETLKEVEKIIEWLESIRYCNTHDDAWIEETINKLKEDLKK